jgi:hypothetical protein
MAVHAGWRVKGKGIGCLFIALSVSGTSIGRDEELVPYVLQP